MLSPKREFAPGVVTNAIIIAAAALNTICMPFSCVTTPVQMSGVLCRVLI
jgi:hypothetical protein